jgi:hypothetical protein
MTFYDDDPGDMTLPSAADDLEDRRIEALLRGTAVSEEPRLAELLLLARSIGQAPAPQPSPALAALLSGGAAPEQPARMDPRWRRRFATIAMVSIGSSAAVVSAAAANVLPQQAQQAVARVVNDVSPLTLPGAHPVRHPKPVKPAATQPTTSATSPTTVARTPAAAAPATQPTPAPSRTPGSGVPSATNPGHPPGQVGGPTELPSQATGPGDDHGRPTHTPSVNSGDGRGKGSSQGGSHDDGSKTPRSAKPTPKPTHATGGGKSIPGNATSKGTGAGGHG